MDDVRFETDLGEALKLWRYWLYTPITHLLLQSRRQIIGILWIPITLLIIISLKSYLLVDVLSVKFVDYVPNLIVGIIVWRYISGILVASCSAITDHRMVYTQQKAPLTIYIFFQFIKNLIIFLVSFLPFLPALLYFHIPHPIGICLFLLAFVLLTLFLILAGCILSNVGVTIRDTKNAVSSTMAALFILTPVFWPADLVSGSRQIVLNLNPFYHLLETVRDPFIGNPIDLINWLVTISLSVVLFVIAATLYRARGRRVLLWL